METKIEAFFEEYSASLDQGRLAQVTACSLVPMIFVANDQRYVCATIDDIEKVNQALLSGLQHGGVVRHEPQILHSMRLSDAIRFVTIKWQFRDLNNDILFTSHCSYTLQQDDGGKLKIIVALLDDDEKVISKLIESVTKKP